MLDKAGLAHILGRHHPNFRLGADKAVQSNFNAKTTIDELVSTISGIIKENKEKVKQLMSNKGANTGTFEYNGKTYQLGIDRENKNRIG